MPGGGKAAVERRRWVEGKAVTKSRERRGGVKGKAVRGQGKGCDGVKGKTARGQGKGSEQAVGRQWIAMTAQAAPCHGGPT